MRKSAYVAALMIIFLLNLSDARSQSPASGPIRTVLALGRVNGPLQDAMQLNLSRVVIPPGAKVRYTGAPALIYLVTGQLLASVGGDKRPVREGEGIHIPANVEHSFEASPQKESELLVYRLMPDANDTSATPISAPANSAVVHRMKLSPSLKSGPFEFSMTRVTLPAGASRPADNATVPAKAPRSRGRSRVPRASRSS